jgi:hypothetical protein
MKTHVEFRSDRSPPYPGEDEEVNPGIWGKRLRSFWRWVSRIMGLPLVNRAPKTGAGWFRSRTMLSRSGSVREYEEYSDGFLCSPDEALSAPSEAAMVSSFGLNG